jgi:site-specific recombinase XerD
VRTVAEGLEWSYGWQPSAAHRLRFLIDFSYSTGLRAGELVHATLGSIEVDAHGDTWLHVVGKGSKAGKVLLPGLARGGLDRHLAQRGLPVTPAKWNPATPVLGSLDGEAGITSKRLWAIVKRFFATTARCPGRHEVPRLPRSCGGLRLTGCATRMRRTHFSAGPN